MADDIRIRVNLRDHRKIRAASRALSIQRELLVGHLVTLWCRVAIVDESGTQPMHPDDVEEWAGWRGMPGQLTAALVDAGLLDAVEGGVICHDWQAEQGWVTGAPARRQRARAAARARWAETPPDAQSNAQSNAPSNAQSNAGSNAKIAIEHDAPSPSPSPLINTHTHPGAGKSRQGNHEPNPVSIEDAIADFREILVPVGWADVSRRTKALQWGLSRVTDPMAGADTLIDRSAWRATLERLRDRGKNLGDGTRGLDWLTDQKADRLRRVGEGQYDDRKAPQDRARQGKRGGRTRHRPSAEEMLAEVRAISPGGSR